MNKETVKEMLKELDDNLAAAWDCVSVIRDSQTSDKATPEDIKWAIIACNKLRLLREEAARLVR
jgi:hypothetical protein